MTFEIYKKLGKKGKLPKSFNWLKNSRAIHGGRIFTVSFSRDIKYLSKDFCKIIYRIYRWGILPRVGTKNTVDSSVWLIDEDNYFGAYSLPAKTMLQILQFIDEMQEDKRFSEPFKSKWLIDGRVPGLIHEQQYIDGTMIAPINEAKKKFYDTIGIKYQEVSLKSGPTIYPITPGADVFFMYGCPYYHEAISSSVSLLKTIALRDELEDQT